MTKKNVIEFTIEFYGVAQMVIGMKSLRLTMPEGTTLLDINRVLTQQFPQATDKIVQKNGGNIVLQQGHIYCLNGSIFTNDPDQPIATNDVLLLISSSAGG